MTAGTGPRTRRSGGTPADGARTADSTGSNGGSPPRVAAPAGSESGRTVRGAATVQAFLDAAIASLVKVGYGGTTIAEISRRAGVSPGLFVRYWPTKADLLAAAATDAQRRSFARFEDRWAAATTTDATRLAQLRAAIATVVELYADPEMRCLAELEHAARTDRQLAATLVAATRSVDEVIVQHARRLAPAEATAERFDDSVRIIIDTARGVNQRTAAAPPDEAARARADAAHALARLVGVADT